MRASLRLVLTVVFALTGAAGAQQTANTACNTSGNRTNCTTTSQQDQQQNAYMAGQQVGNALGDGIAGAMEAHAFTKGLRRYCDAHPGQDWHYYSRANGRELSSGHCPNDQDKALEAANIFMAKHRDYKPDPANSKAMTDYLTEHRLDPREVKSYERAYKELRRSKQLQLYAKK